MRAATVVAAVYLFLHTSATLLTAQSNRFEVSASFSAMQADFRPPAPDSSAITQTGSPLTGNRVSEIQSLHNVFFGKTRIMGGQGAFTINLTSLLGITVDISGHSGKRSEPITGAFQRTSGTYEALAGFQNSARYTIGGVVVPFRPMPTNAEWAYAASGKADIENGRISFLVGPRLTFRDEGKMRPFVHALVGGSRIKTAAAGQYSLSATIGPPGGSLRREAVGRTDTYLDYTFSGSSRFDNNLGKSSSVNMGLAFAAGGGIDLALNKSLSIRMIQLDYVAARNRISYGSQLSGQRTEGPLSYTETWYVSGAARQIERGTITPRTATEPFAATQIGYTTKTKMLSNIRVGFGVAFRF